MNIYHFTEEQLRKLLAETISMNTDYRRQYDWTPDQVVQEVIEGLDAEHELFVQGELKKPSQIIIGPSAYIYPAIEALVTLQDAGE